MLAPNARTRARPPASTSSTPRASTVDVAQGPHRRGAPGADARCVECMTVASPQACTTARPCARHASALVGPNLARVERLQAVCPRTVTVRGRGSAASPRAERKTWPRPRRGRCSGRRPHRRALGGLDDDPVARDHRGRPARADRRVAAGLDDRLARAPSPAPSRRPSRTPMPPTVNSPSPAQTGTTSSPRGRRRAGAV